MGSGGTGCRFARRLTETRQGHNATVDPLSAAVPCRNFAQRCLERARESFGIEQGRRLHPCAQRPPQLIQSILDQVQPTAILDIGITALLIYWLFSFIRGTSAVRLVIGVSVLFAVYFAARIFNLRLLTQILETAGVVGLFALVVVFQPELRRALDRIGRMGSLGWLLSAEDRAAEVVATEVARAAAGLSAEGHGALIVIERETGLEQIAETGVMIHGDLSADLLRTIFSPRSPLHDGAVIVRGTRILAAGALQIILMPLVGLILPGRRGYEGWVFTFRDRTIPYGKFLGQVATTEVVRPATSTTVARR